MTYRNVITVLILSIITCGIYTLYWFYVTAEELNNEDSNDHLANYVVALLLSCVTCGIYGLYWNYKFYKKVDSVTGEDNCIINFVLSIFLTPLAGMAIAQSAINKLK